MLRLGIDLDGTIADLASAWHAIDVRLFGDTAAASDEAPRDEAEASDASPAAEGRAAGHMDERRRTEVWRVIRSTPDFWTTLAPIEPGAVRCLYDVSITERWEVFFLTQRPRTAGDTVQRQSQRWLAAEGFEHPSVVTLTGSRGAAAAALYLDALIDDLPRNCLDVVSDSACRPLLVLRTADVATETSARRLNVTVVPSVAAAIGELLNPRPVRGRSRTGRGPLSLAGLFGWEK